jgi:Aspartyl/Asparaginyl beta-hydroxylase
MFIKKLDITSDPNLVLSDLNNLLPIIPPDLWNNRNQIGLKYRNNSTDIWNDAVGSLYDRKNKTYTGHEYDFVNWSIDQDSYTRQAISTLETTLGIKTGRARFMRLAPRSGLTVHSDAEVRYHLVLKTNEFAYIGHKIVEINATRCELPTTGINYHIPKDNTWYRVDTTQHHWVYNGGPDERIHLVVCGI